MLNLAPWYYKKLFTENDIINKIEYFEIDLITKVHQFEAVAFLKDNLVPNWVGKSQIYKNCDGSGTSSHKNIAVYKSISEALERLAYYQLVDSDKYAFHLNPSTTGMAAFPHFVNKNVRRNAKPATSSFMVNTFNCKFNFVVKVGLSFKNIPSFFFEVFNGLMN